VANRCGRGVEPFDFLKGSEFLVITRRSLLYGTGFFFRWIAVWLVDWLVGWLVSYLVN
jgi:hypothetical protein